MSHNFLTSFQLNKYKKHYNLNENPVNISELEDAQVSGEGATHWIHHGQLGRIGLAGEVDLHPSNGVVHWGLRHVSLRHTDASEQAGNMSDKPGISLLASGHTLLAKPLLITQELMWLRFKSQTESWTMSLSVVSVAAVTLSPTWGWTEAVTR